MSRNKITPVTDREINAIINNSVQGAGSRLVGSAAEQKKLFVRPIANTDGTPNVASLVKRLAEETEAAVGQLEKEVDALETPPPPDSLPLMGVFLTYDEETETLNIIGEKGVDSEEVQDIVGNSTDAKFEEIGASLNQLTEQKQDKLTFADAYNPTTNKVATEQTVATEIAKIIGGADTSFDTLKEIADWINAHPESVTEINNKIKANASNISANQTAITNLQTLVQLLETNKQNATASNLLTAAKNIVGAINEVNKKVDDIPAWAKQPQKPQYSYNEIKNTPDFIENVDTANILYGTDENGNPALYPTDSVGTQVLVDGQKVKEFNADEKFDKAGGVVGGDVTIQGNLYVSGENSVVDTETLLVKDNVIVANADNDKLAGVSGFAVKTGEVNEETQKQLAYGIMYDKLGNGVKIGLGGFNENGEFVYGDLIVENEDGTSTTIVGGQAQFLATRADSLGNGNIPKWDNEKKQFVDSGKVADDLVKKTDKAGAGVLGLIAVGNSFCTQVNSSGGLMCRAVSLTDYPGITSAAFISKGTLENIKYNYVMEGLANYTVAEGETSIWTPEAQTKARELIGAVGFTDIATADKAGVVKVNQGNSGMRVLDGQLRLYPASPVAITLRPQSGVNYGETGPITLGNLNEAVIATLTDDKKIQMSEEQKTKACETIGAVRIVIVDILDIIQSQNGDLVIELTKQYLDKKIIMIGTLDGLYCVVSNIAYVDDDMITWSLEASRGSIQGGVVTSASLAVFILTKRGNTISYGLSNYSISDTITQTYAENNFVAKETITSGNGRAYGYTKDGETSFEVVGGEAKPWTIAQRTSNGRVKVGTPEENNDAVPLEYFNQNKGTKLYLHDISFTDVGVGPSERSNRAKIISTKSTPYTSLSMDDFIDGSMINFQICMYEGNEISWASYRHITGFVIYLHGVSANATTTASIRFEDINDGLSDTVTAL